MSPYTQAQWDQHFNKPFNSDLEFAKLQFKALKFESSEESYALKKREGARGWRHNYNRSAETDLGSSPTVRNDSNTCVWLTQ